LTYTLIFGNLALATVPGFVPDSTARLLGGFRICGVGVPLRTVDDTRESIRALRKCPSKFGGVQGLPRYT
jgi:hypothetical protein